ncbi:MAG: hypothetical protein F6K40_16085 [Okeania sp. SIO3I5]|uniref:hypothetical protein n=1 Tax=Okeania sp. SIO3I5 TaxID=2607805 RepID=UPI0013BD5CEA|nr:hypothetical protein [Okeania sp. SIO3I5]NEQ37702.1 hypothetical protein [Okeania sp. SIO3I5]
MHTISLLAHAPEFHVPNKNDDSKAEVKQVENNSVDKKTENHIQKTSSTEVETQLETVVEEKVINSVDLPQTNIFMPQPGEIVFLLLLTMPFLLFSMKQYIFR